MMSGTCLMSCVLGCLLLSASASVSVLPVPSTSTLVTIAVIFGSTPPTLSADRAAFSAAFKLGFSQSVAVAGCLASAPAVDVSVVYAGTLATVVFEYPITADLYAAVARVVAQPAVWFSKLDNTAAEKTLLKYLTPSPPGGFVSSIALPALVVPTTGGCSPPPARKSLLEALLPLPLPSVSLPSLESSPPPVASTPVLPPRIFRGFPSRPPPIVPPSAVPSVTLPPTVSTDILPPMDLPSVGLPPVSIPPVAVSVPPLAAGVPPLAGSVPPLAISIPPLDVSIPPLDVSIPPLAVGAPPATLPSVTLPPSASLSLPPAGEVPATLAQLMSSPQPPPPPFLTVLDVSLITTITFTGSLAAVVGRPAAFSTQLGAALSALFCTGFLDVTVGAATAVSASTFKVPIAIMYTAAVSASANPKTCSTFTYLSLVKAFSGVGSTTCGQRLRSQDPTFATQWGPITKAVCTLTAAGMGPPAVSGPPSSPPMASSPPPSYGSTPPLYSSAVPPTMVKRVVEKDLSGVAAGLNPPPASLPLPPLSTVVRRLTERKAMATASRFADLEAADVAYGADKNLYEVFAEKVSYYEAGAICNSRGGSLASYASEASQIFTDLLCGSGMSCWVEGNSAGRCSAVTAAQSQQLLCSTHQNFVCATAQV